jgi:sugar lactone lactonase YvrE
MARSSSIRQPASIIAQIDVPERPSQLIFGGKDRKTLSILAHHVLFAAQVR